MGIVSVDNDGIIHIEYNLLPPLPNEEFILASPDATSWNIRAFGEEGDYRADSDNGPYPAPIRKVYASPNGVAWELTVNNTGILSLTPFSSSLLLSPVGNSQFKLVSGALAVGYKVFIRDDNVTLVLADTFADTSRLIINPNPLIVNANGFASAPIFIEAGRVYRLQLTPPSENFPPSIIEQEWQGISVGAGATGGNITEWVEPSTTATIIGSQTVTVPGDQRQQYRVGRRVRSGTSGVA